MTSRATRIFSAVVAGAMVTVGGTFVVSSAAYADPSVVAAHSEGPVPVQYSDSQVVQFLLFGQGAIASAHPDLAAKVTQGRTIPAASDSDVSSLTSQLLAIDPAFHEIVTLGVQKKDPYATRAAIVQLNTDIKSWISAQDLRSVAVTPKDWFYASSNVAVAENVGLLTTVAVTVGAVASVLAVFLALYQFDGSSQDRLASDGWAADLATSL